MQKFNESTLVSTYIKELLKTINLPQCTVVSDLNEIVYDGLYLNKTDNYIYRHSNSSTKRVCTYSYNQKILNVTKTFKNTGMSYDSYTHKWLGDYLRFYRDYKGIDLMSMYNCFADEYPDNLLIRGLDGNNEEKFRFDTKESGFKILMVSIKPNKEYTISLNSNAKIEVVAGFYNNTQLDSNYSDNSDIWNHTWVQFSNVSTQNPYLYKGVVFTDDFNPTQISKLYHNYEDLKLFIKIPSFITSSVVVLEGDYTNTSKFTFDNKTNITKVSELFYGEDFTDDDTDREGNTLTKKSVLSSFSKTSIPHKMQLLEIAYERPVAFADMLIEYLVEYTITDDTDFSKNITRLQKSLNIEDRGEYAQNYINGMWDYRLQVMLKLYIQSKNLTSNEYDILGYGDKEVEDTLQDIINTEWSEVR